MQPPNNKNLLAQGVAMDAVRLLRPLVERIHRHDRSLADQLKRAASSVVLNLAEASYNNAGNRRARFESARGSANEARAAIALANAWGYVPAPEAAQVDALRPRVGDDLRAVEARVAAPAATAAFERAIGAG